MRGSGVFGGVRCVELSPVAVAVAMLRSDVVVLSVREKRCESSCCASNEG